MDLPMINSPTRFMTASMRVASTRRVLSATAAAAEPAAAGTLAEAPSAGSAPLGTRESGLDDFDGSGGDIIFRTQGDDGAAAVKDVSNELEGGGAHQAIGIDAKSDVIDSLAAMHGFRNHELLIFGPGKLGGQLRRHSAGAAGRRGPLQQFANHGMERFNRWR